MSYFGSPFPPEINPDEYFEISSPEQIKCPEVRRSSLSALNSLEDIDIACSGCQIRGAFKMVLDGEGNERLFVRNNSSCTSSPQKLA